MTIFSAARNLSMPTRKTGLHTKYLHLLTILTLVLPVTHLRAGDRNKEAVESMAHIIEKAASTEPTVQGDVVRIEWSREDVEVTVDGMPLPPTAGLGSWAAFKPAGDGAMVMGDTVVFQDEVAPAMHAAFAHGLEVTALHNHFFYDQPKVYFMHISGHGDFKELASDVKAVWDSIKQVREDHPQPVEGFREPTPKPGGKISVADIEEITGLKAEQKPGGVVKVSTARGGAMHGIKIGGAMGLTSWAAFVGSDALASIDGDFIMTAAEVQPVLRALRAANIYIVALHNHMMGEKPTFYFTHFWGKGSAMALARGFKAAMQAQAKTQ
jgi:hypothetical protein